MRVKLFTLQFFFDSLFTLVYLLFVINLFFLQVDNTYWAWFGTSTVVVIERWVSHIIWYHRFKKNKNVPSLANIKKEDN